MPHLAVEQDGMLADDTVAELTAELAAGLLQLLYEHDARRRADPAPDTTWELPMSCRPIPTANLA